MALIASMSAGETAKTRIQSCLAKFQLKISVQRHLKKLYLKLLRYSVSSMIVGTADAAKILNISTARLRVLLIAGRVQGAYKTGKMWLMPLFNGKPIIKRGKRGPAPSWRNPRTPAKTIIHVNSQRIRQNQKHQQNQPVITVKKNCSSQLSTPSVSEAEHKVGSATKGQLNLYGHEVEIPGGCRVVYRPNSSRCGAKVWIETLYDVKVFSFDRVQIC